MVVYNFDFNQFFSKNKIVLFSTHIVPAVEYIADDIMIMKDKKIIHEREPEEILK